MKLKPILLILLTVLILFSSQLQIFSQSTYTLSEIGAINVSARAKGLNSLYGVDVSRNTAYFVSYDNNNLFQWYEPGDGCTYTQCGSRCCVNGCCPTNSGTCAGFSDCISSSSSSGGSSLTPLKISISGNNSVTIPQGREGVITTIKVAAEGLEGNISCSLRSDQSLLAVRFYPRKFFLSSQESIKEVKISIKRFSSTDDDLNVTARCGEDLTADFNIMIQQK